MLLNTEQTYEGFALQTDSIKMLNANGHTSYIFPVKLSSPRAVTFQNLTIDQSPGGTKIFVNTYTPTQQWIADWRAGKAGKFEGEISVSYLNGDSNPSSLKGSNNNMAANGKIAYTNVPNKIMLEQEACSTTTYYFALPYNCGSGQHGPGDPGCYLTGDDRAGIAYISFDITTCTPTGGGGGGTSPTPPGDYDPCGSGGNLPTVSYNGATGAKLMVHENPDCNTQPPVLPEEDLNPLEPLQAYNKLCASSFNFHTVVAPGDGSRGWKEASISGLTINVMSTSYFENIWNVLTTGSGSTVGTFNLTVGVPGDLPSANVSKEAGFAVNKAMIDIYRSYGADGVKSLINTGQIGNKIAALAQIQLGSIIPGARVSGALSNRVTATSPVVGVGCQ